jgi:hypothetical protein
LFINVDAGKLFRSRHMILLFWKRKDGTRR